MKSIDRVERQEIRVDLKYCERCGGLWLRLQGAHGVHCASCHVLLETRPDPGVAPLPKPRRRNGRSQGTDAQRADLHSSGRIDYLQGVAMEVRA